MGGAAQEPVLGSEGMEGLCQVIPTDIRTHSLVLSMLASPQSHMALAGPSSSQGQASLSINSKHRSILMCSSVFFGTEREFVLPLVCGNTLGSNNNPVDVSEFEINGMGNWW